jgi:hypothetical protein
MAVMTGLVGALSAFYHDSTDINNPVHREIAAIRLIAKMPTLVAMAYKYGIGQPFIYPKNDLSYSSNFMRMMFATPARNTSPTTCWSAPSTASSSCTPTTSRTRPLRPLGCAAAAARTRSRPSPPAWPVCGGRRMAGANEPR